MKIAIIGSGISGLTAFHLLRRKHDVTLFEAAARIGGHTHTVAVQDPKGMTPVDTGFIVFNERTYPNFVRLLRDLEVRWQRSEMSFSVRSPARGIEYNGTTLDTLFAQRRNLLRPSFLGMVRDILRFNREATRIVRGGRRIGADVTLQSFLSAERFGRTFVDDYVVPMGAAIWSADPKRMLEFPFLTFARFFHNHGMLTVDDRPQWLVVAGGSRRYVDALIRGQESRIRTATPIGAIQRRSDCVEVVPRNAPVERFDQVVVAVHSDQALAMLADPSADERAVLSVIPYQPNAVTLHRDTSLMPRRRKCWAAWNYHRDEQTALGVTYWMNRLQSLGTEHDYCVTLNRDSAIADDQVVERFVYDHPIFTREGIAAQPRQDSINGVRRTWFCGAYFGYGFHEDGVNSALAVTRRFGETLT